LMEWRIGGNFTSSVANVASAANTSAFCPSAATGWRRFVDGAWSSAQPSIAVEEPDPSLEDARSEMQHASNDTIAAWVASVLQVQQAAIADLGGNSTAWTPSNAVITQEVVNWRNATVVRRSEAGNMSHAYLEVAVYAMPFSRLRLTFKHCLFAVMLRVGHRKSSDVVLSCGRDPGHAYAFSVWMYADKVAACNHEHVGIAVTWCSPSVAICDGGHTESYYKQPGAEHVHKSLV
jgi:hypothetical protein